VELSLGIELLAFQKVFEDVHQTSDALRYIPVLQERPLAPVEQLRLLREDAGDPVRDDARRQFPDL
jgi:hypothetical protein